MTTLKIYLPSAEIEIASHYKASQPLLIITGGRQPKPDWLRSAAKNCGEVFAVDRGITSCKAADIIPNVLIGDCDSSESENWQWAEQQNVQVHKYKCDKDFTDSQLAIRLIADKYAERSLFLTGSWGGRFDHLYSLMHSFLESALPNVPRIIADEKETMIILNGGEKLNVKFAEDFTPEALSLIPLSDICSGITMKGTHWELKDASVLRSCPYAISNRMEKRDIELSLADGTLGFYFCAPQRASLC